MKRMNYYTFKNGTFKMRVPGKDEADARTCLPDNPDFGRWKLHKEEKK